MARLKMSSSKGDVWVGICCCKIGNVKLMDKDKLMDLNGISQTSLKSSKLIHQ